jgi:hypothetical protein
MSVTGRSYERITRRDLRKLVEIARADREAFFARPSKSRAFRHRVVATALCQGAALHYINGTNGIKDFDVFTFFAALRGKNFPSRRKVQIDFGPSKFGRWEHGKRPFEGRHVDLMWRALRVGRNPDAMEAVRAYVANTKTDTAILLRQKAIVMLEPMEFLGVVAWPT